MDHRVQAQDLRREMHNKAQVALLSNSKPETTELKGIL